MSRRNDERRNNDGGNNRTERTTNVTQPKSPVSSGATKPGPGRAPDPIRVATGAGDRSRGEHGYNDNRFSTYKGEPTARTASPYRAVKGDAAQPGRGLDPAPGQPLKRRNLTTGLRLDPAAWQAPGQQVKSTKVESSPSMARENTCKARPESNKPKGGGGGRKRKYVPWCG